MDIIDKFLKKLRNNPESSQPLNSTDPSLQLENAIKKLLIVVADEILKSQYIEHIPNEKFLIHSVGNGAEGLNALLTFKPDAVLLDLDLPIMDGKEMLHHMRALQDYKSTPVLVVSDSGDLDTMHHITVYDGAGAFLIKSTVTPAQTIENLFKIL